MSDHEKKSSGVLIGYKGVKYGLQKSKAVSAPKPAAFGDDSSSEDEVEVQLKKQQQQNLKASKIAAARAAALTEDSTVYEYDAVYDDIQRSREAPKRKEVEERRPKYIQALMQKAEIRKKEQDIAYERRLLKERKKDDHLYEEKEAFLTSAYKKKLVEDKYWIERERRMDAIEEAEDVTKKSDLTGFYQNLVTKNVAFASNRLAEGEDKGEAPSEPLVESADSEPSALPSEPIPAVMAQDNVKETVSTERNSIKPSNEEMSVKEEKALSENPVIDRRKRRNDDASIASARERFLARKRRTQGGVGPADSSV